MNLSDKKKTKKQKTIIQFPIAYILKIKLEDKISQTKKILNNTHETEHE